MASILKKPLKDGGHSWQVFVSVKGFPRISKTFKSQAEAERFGQAQELTLKQSKIAAPAQNQPKKRTLDDLLKTPLKDLLSKHFVEGPCLSRYKRNVKPVIALAGNAKVADIDEYWVEDYIKKARATHSEQDKPYAYSTIRDQLTMARLAIRMEARELRVPRPTFPFRKSMLPQGWRVRRKRRLSKQEDRALLGALRKMKGPRRHHWRLMVRLALATGARLQELLFARWSDFDMSRLAWTIPAQTTKTRRERTVPLGARARRILRQLRLIQDPSSELVFHCMDTPANCSQQFRKICQQAHLKDFRFHDLRHEAISRLYIHERHLDERHISVIVGHSSLEQTRDYVALRADEFALRMR